MADRQPDNAAMGILLSDDLIFTSRITGTGRDLGLTIQPTRSAESLRELVQERSPACVLLDLHHPELRIAEMVAFLREGCRPAPFVVGYGSHVATEVLKSARAAGCDLVLPRSKFVEDLPTDLPKWFACGVEKENGR